MGYDAFVRCNCYELGKTKPFKYSQFIKTYPECLYLELPDVLPKTVKESKEKIKELYNEWYCSNPCEHEDMDFCNEWIANVSGMGWLKSCIYWLGGEKEFPALGTQLPDYNDGFMPIKFNNQFRDDLKRFIEKKLTTYYLETKDCNWYIEGNTGNEIDELLCKNDDIELHSYKGKIRIEKNKNVIFEANKFSVEKINDNKYIYATENNKIEIPIFHMPHIFDKQKKLNFYFEEQNWNMKDEFKFKYNTFIKLLDASDKTGNPICWC